MYSIHHKQHTTHQHTAQLLKKTLNNHTLHNIYYRFIDRFSIGLDFFFITFTFLLHLDIHGHLLCRSHVLPYPLLHSLTMSFLVFQPVFCLQLYTLYISWDTVKSPVGQKPIGKNPMVKSPMVKSPTTSQQSGQKPHHYDPITIGGSSDMTHPLNCN